MRINDADPIQSGSQIISTPYPTFCWSAPPEAANYGIYIISNDAPTAIMESAYPISETCYTAQQALGFNRQYDTQVFAHDYYGNIVAFGSFLFDLRDGAGTTLTFSEFQPTPGGIIQQDVNPHDLLSVGGLTNAIYGRRLGNAGKNLNALQSSLVRLNLQPIVHSVVLCSKGSNINLGSIRVFIDGRNVTREAGIYPWPADADCTSRGGSGNK